MMPLFRVAMAPEAADMVAETLYSGYVSEGPQVEAFERAFAEWLGVDQVLALNSCTAALQLAAYLAGVRPGSVVVTTPMTCTATNTALVAMGARLLWADVDPFTGNISPESVRRLCEGWKVDAVMAVDWAGRPCHYPELRQAAGLVPIIRDASHAIGAPYSPTPDYTCYSFQAIKTLTTGDGGALVCSPPDHARGKLLRWYGLDRDARREERVLRGEPGWKYHMNDVAATIGLANLPYLDDHLERMAYNVGYLDAAFGREGCELPLWMYPVLVDEPREFQRHMRANGIDCHPVHLRNDTMPGLEKHAVNARDSLPSLQHFATYQMNIPCGWWLNDDDLEHIVDTARGWV